MTKREAARLRAKFGANIVRDAANECNRGKKTFQETVTYSLYCIASTLDDIAELLQPIDDIGKKDKEQDNN